MVAHTDREHRAECLYNSSIVFYTGRQQPQKVLRVQLDFDQKVRQKRGRILTHRFGAPVQFICITSQSQSRHCGLYQII